MRPGKILRLQSDLAARQRVLPLHHAGLSPRDLVLGDAPHILPGGSRTERGEKKR